jgi:hypothetical protein
VLRVRGAYVFRPVGALAQWVAAMLARSLRARKGQRGRRGKATRFVELDELGEVGEDQMQYLYVEDIILSFLMGNIFCNLGKGETYRFRCVGSPSIEKGEVAL